MKDFKDKVAVVTGAASGIGKALALKCAELGMKLVLADIDKEGLKEVEQLVKEQGREVISLVTDVSKAEDMEKLACRATGKFRYIHLFFNNAGVGAGSLLWKNTAEDWKWVFDVNVGSTIHAIKNVLPLMLNQQDPSRMIFTASMAGFTPTPANGIYSATKSAIISLCEVLDMELRFTGKQVGVSVACPGFVKTQINNAERNKPEQNSGKKEQLYSEQLRALAGTSKAEKKLIEEVKRVLTEGVEKGMTPEAFAEIVFKGIEEEKLYIFSEKDQVKELETRLMHIKEQSVSLE